MTLYALPSLVTDSTYTITAFFADHTSLGESIERALERHRAATAGRAHGLPFLRVELEFDGWRGAWYSEELEAAEEER